MLINSIYPRANLVTKVSYFLSVVCEQSVSALDELLGSTQPSLSNTTLMLSSSNQLPAGGSIPATFQPPGITAVHPPSTGVQLASAPLQQSTFQTVFAARPTNATPSSQNTATPLQPRTAFSPTEAAQPDLLFSSEF